MNSEETIDTIELLMTENDIPLRDVIRRILGHAPKIHWENILECIVKEVYINE